MRKLSSTLSNMVLSLTLVAIVAGGVLAGVNEITKSQIERINDENLAKGIRSVMGGGNLSVDTPREKDGYVLYDVKDEGGNPVGTAVAVTAQGFGGDMRILVGFGTDGGIKGYTVLGNSETPGLGAKVTTWFQKGHEGDIIGKNPGTDNLSVSKDGGEVDAITASTITSRAFLNAVKEAYGQLSVGKEKEDAHTGASPRQAD